MKKHIKFLPGQQSEFLRIVAQRSRLSTEKLARLVGISSRNYRDWLREKFSISLNAARILALKFNINFPEKEEVLTRRWKTHKSNAGKIGGITCYKKHGNPGTLSGRKKGGRNALKKLRRLGIIPEAKDFKLPEKYSVDLAEFVGILLGDGSLTSGQCTITLNRKKDADFINYVLTIGKKLFGEQGKIYERKKQNATVICYNGINLVKYFVSLGLKTGNKVKQQVSPPQWILKRKDYKSACLRGLMDTDGGVFVHKYTVRKKRYTYRKICFTNQSVPLITFAHDYLKDIGLTPRMTSYVGKYKVWLYNSNEVQKYFDLVGSNNTRLLRFMESGPDGKAQVC